MTQNDPKTDAGGVMEPVRPISMKIASALLGGASVVALSVPLTNQGALAQGFVVTRQYYPGGSIAVYREFGSRNSHVSQLREPVSGNNCPVPAFEVVNPRPGEARCVGYVVPSWLTR